MALEDLGYNIEAIAACSGGAIIGGFYCAGYSSKELKSLFLNTDLWKLKKFSLVNLIKNWGLYSSAPLEDFFNSFLKDVKFKDLEKDFYVCMTDILQNSSCVLSKDSAPDMPVSEAITISSSVPLFYGIRKYRDKYVVDGALTKMFPIDIFDGSDNVIGFQIQGSQPIYSIANMTFPRYVRRVVSSLFDALSHTYLDPAKAAKTIFINTGPISAIDFNLTRDDKSRLLDIGYQSVIDWHKKK
jgi:NTE family protein